MNSLIVCLIICFVVLIGYSFIKIFNFLPGKSALSILGYSYGLGVGSVALQLYVYSRLSIPWEKPYIVVPWIILFVVTFLSRKAKRNFSFKYKKLTKIQFLLLILISASILYVFLETLIRPLAVWDGWAIWLLKSKVFFIDGNIVPSVLDYVRSDYPLVVSLFGTFIYLLLGHVDDTAVLLAFFAFYLFTGIIFFSVIKEKFGMTYALLMTFMLLTLQNLIRHGGRYEVGQADLALGYYIFISATLLIDYIRKQEVKILILLNVLLGITGLVKFEGIPFVLAVQAIIIYFILKEKRYRRLFLAIIWILPIAEWELFKKVNGISVSYFLAHRLEFSFSKIISSSVGIAKELLNIKSWNFLWISYLFSLLLFRVKNIKLNILNILILFQLFAYTTLYFFTFGNSPESSIERLLVHVAPLTMLYIAIFVKETYGKTDVQSNCSKLLRCLGRKG
jgi:hypothetical protein